MNSCCVAGSWRTTLARLPGCTLLLMALAFTAAVLTERSYLSEATVLAALLMPLLWLAVVPAGAISDGLFARWLLLAIVLLAWMAGVQALRAEALPAGWLRFAERGAALAACLMVALGRQPVREMITLIGCSASLVTIIAVVMDGLAGHLRPFDITSFGFGQLNILTDTAGPALLAWAVLIIADARLGRRINLRDLAVALLGIAAMAIIVVATRRRGVAVAVAVAALWPACAWLWHRWPRTTIAGVLALVLALLLILARLFSDEMPGLRFERISLAKVAIEGAISGLPWGFGHYAMLHTLDLGGEACRHFTASGSWMQHAHNEFLDVAIDGGPIALALVLGLTALLGYRLLTVRDAQVRLALQMMGIAIVVHLLTDNVFGLAPTELWLGAVIGMMFSAPVAGGAIAPPAFMPPPRVLAWIFTLLACWGAWTTIPAAFLDGNAGSGDRLRCLATSREPLVVNMLLCSMQDGQDPAFDAPRARQALAQAVRTIGWNGQSAAIAARQALNDKQYQVAAAALLRMLAYSPFYRQAYQDLGELLQRHRELVAGIPLPVQRRLSYLSGNPRLPPPDLGHQPQTIEEAADAYAGITWAIATGRSWEQLSTPLHQLIRRYGDIPGVSQLVLQAVLAAPAGTFPWLAQEIPVLEVGLRFGFDALGFFSTVTTPDQARALMPVVAAFYPEEVRDVHEGRMSRPAESPELRNALVRIIAMAGGAPAR